MNKDEAMLVATDWIGREARSPSSALYSRHPTLVRIYQGRNSTGAPAWVAVYEAKSIPDRTCVWVWSEGGPLSERTISEIDLCEPETPTETEKPA